ncbi:O-phosphoseryl-tRNA(Sec) selenium transferase-like [Clytia hemisphaerica]|uniref:O-phosphoseryl-tRNA(Sec) selenium transferase n=1 Tax=Clytia hemisphaerica TaxID=252671 RepID=A0A7M5WVY5_9CNID|eukprot:TCONS_00016201-protein
MNEENFKLAEKYVSTGYVNQGKEARRVLEKNLRTLLEQGKIPTEGWNDLSIRQVLNEIALMDSNNFPNNCGVGEREARIASRLVAERHFHLGHGMGRSGDIAEIQPKAAGSSLVAKLANSFALDVIKMAGVSSIKSCLVCPVATGMALVLSMITLKEKRPEAKYVIWSRIDQKSCFKSILTAGLEPIIIENILNEGDYLSTDVDSIRTTIERIGSQHIACVLTTTSCFAPRVPDRLEEIALVCKDLDVPHVVNNAYGIQASKCMHLLQQANRVGRVDVFVQSTDKNFMVPVGGSIIAGFDKQLIQDIGKMYPGRASASPIIDFFITMLSLGANGYKKLLQERKELYQYLHDGMKRIAKQFNETVIPAKENTISIALSLRSLDERCDGQKKSITEFGSHLFKRSVSGTRVVTPNDEKTIGRYQFIGWGAHYSNYPCSYLTAAAAIGATRQDIDLFLKRLEKNFKDFLKEPSKKVSSSKKETDKSATVKLNGVSPTTTTTTSTNGGLIETSFSSSLPRTRTEVPRALAKNPLRVINSCGVEGDTSKTWPKQSKEYAMDDSAIQKKRNQWFNNVDGKRKSQSTTSVDERAQAVREERTQQVITKKDLSPDKMSFLIDL